MRLLISLVLLAHFTESSSALFAMDRICRWSLKVIGELEMGELQAIGTNGTIRQAYSLPENPDRVVLMLNQSEKLPYRKWSLGRQDWRLLHNGADRYHELEALGLQTPRIFHLTRIINSQNPARAGSQPILSGVVVERIDFRLVDLIPESERFVLPGEPVSSISLNARQWDHLMKQLHIGLYKFELQGKHPDDAHLGNIGFNMKGGMPSVYWFDIFDSASWSSRLERNPVQLLEKYRPEE